MPDMILDVAGPPPAPLNPLDMVRLAIERDVSPDHLGKLLDLSERFQRSEAQRAFYAAMPRAQAEMPIIVRHAENKGTKSLYARLETVTNRCKPVWLKHGFSLSFSEAKPDREGFIRVVCVVRHEAGHSETHYIELPPDGVGAKGGAIAMNAVQGVGSTHTYAVRYLTVNIFGITIADTDDDAAGATQCINGNDLVEINRLLEELPAGVLDFEQFLAWAGVESLDKLPVRRFEIVTRELKRKITASRKAAKT